MSGERGERGELSLIARLELAAEDGEHYEVHLTEVPEVLRAVKIVEKMEASRARLVRERDARISDWHVVVESYGVSSDQAFLAGCRVKPLKEKIDALDVWLGGSDGFDEVAK